MSIKRTITIISTAALLLLLTCIYTVSNTYATQDLKLSMDSIDMDKKGGVVWLERDYDGEEDISRAEVSEKGILHLVVEDDGVDITAIGLGDTVLKVIGDEGTEVTVPVHVGKKGLKSALKQTTDASELYYGDKTLSIDTRAGNKVTVKIGKDTYKGVSKKGKDKIESARFKLKKLYDFGTKVKYTVEKDGVAYTGSSKIWNGTFVIRASASGKTIKISTYNCHKGDVFIVKYAGKKYTKKIKKNHDGKNWKCKIKTKKKIGKKAKMRITLKNKYKTNLFNQKIKLKKGKWTAREWL